MGISVGLVSHPWGTRDAHLVGGGQGHHLRLPLCYESKLFYCRVPACVKKNLAQLSLWQRDNLKGVLIYSNRNTGETIWKAGKQELLGFS